MPDKLDVLLTNGTSLDLDTGERAPTSVGIREGRVVSVGEETDAVRVLDCRGALILPGLVDLHSHIHYGVLDVGLRADEAHLKRGVVFVNDAGSVGLSGWVGFRDYTATPAHVGISSFLNVSSVGMVNVHIGEFADPHAVLIDEAAELIEHNRDLIRGVKVRLSRTEAGDQPLERLAQAAQLGEMTGLPVMAHVGASACTLSEILAEMRPGDIVTHSFHGKANGIIEDGRVIGEAWKARERGVIFDVGHGTTQMSYAVARTAIAEGFEPDTISSDLSGRNWRGPAFDLATVVSKLVALGMPLHRALAAATRVPAGILGISDLGYGAIQPGRSAEITVFEERTEVDVVPDAQDDRLELHRLEPLVTVHGEELVDPVAWRGALRPGGGQR